VGTAGLLQIVRLWVRESTVISSASVYVGIAGATLSNVGFGLWSSAGALLTSSVNANGAVGTAFQSVGVKTVTFAAPQTIGTGSFYLGWWTTGTTQPALHRSASTATTNAGLVAPNLRFATANTGLTNTAPATLGTQTSNSSAYWVAAA
jgi:hypothetical protein